MICAIVRHLLSNEYGPFDRLLEFAVLAFIAYEVVTSVWHKRKIRRRSKEIFQLFSKGQALQYAAPPAGTMDEAIVAAWVESVKAWIMEVHKFLEGYSAQAAASFIHESGGVSVTYRGVSGLAEAQSWYATLQTRLNSLRNIMEKLDVYF